MKNALIAVGAITLILFLAGLGKRPPSRLANAASSVILQAMEAGYNCYAAGRTIEDCKNEQIDRWNRAAAGEPLPPRK